MVTAETEKRVTSSSTVTRSCSSSSSRIRRRRSSTSRRGARPLAELAASFLPLRMAGIIEATSRPLPPGRLRAPQARA